MRPRWILVLALVLLLPAGAAAQTPCVVAPGDVAMPLACAAGTYTSPGVTFTPKPVDPPIPPGETNAIDACAPGAFCRLAGTKITDLPLPTTPPGTRAYITAYSGAAFDTRRGCLVLAANGGHNDYGGNEVISLCVGDATLRWKLLSPPSPVIPPIQSACSSYGNTYADGKPASRHTYNGLTYLPDQDTILLLGGLKWCAAGDSVRPVDAWRFNLGSGQWQQMALPPLPTGESLRSVYDPATVSVYANCANSNCTLRRYDPATDTWVTLPGANTYGAYTVALDPKRGMVYLGAGSTTAAISTQSLITGQRTTRVLTGDPLPVTAAKGGLAYDPVADRMLVWAGGLELYEVNLDTNTARRITASGSTPGAASDAGTFGRWAYAPSKDAFLLVTSGSSEASVYKPVRSTPPQPPTTYRMQVPTSGEGHGTTTGAGTYVAGVTVPLSATPDSASVFAGWTPADCGNAPYLMPPRNVICTAAFDVKPLPPDGGGVTLVPGAFVNIVKPSFGGPSSGSKHVTCAPRPGTPLVYCMGGDYQDTFTVTADSYRQGLWTFNLTAALAGDAARGWRLIQTYCQSSEVGGIQPKSPDYQGWVWDATRGGWWSVPGTSFVPVYAVCAGRTVSQSDDLLYKYRHLMLYKPDEANPAYRWTDWDAAFDPSQTYTNWQSVHDAVDDKLVRWVHHGGNGGGIHVYAIPSKTSRYKWMESSTTGNLRLEVSLPCHDAPNRVAYYADPYSNKFYRLDLATETLTRLADVPGPSMGSVDPYVHAVWRASAGECWLWNKADRSLWVYGAAAGTWRREAYTQVPTTPLANVTNAIAWDPTQDVLLFLGTNAPGAGTGVWVYKPR